MGVVEGSHANPLVYFVARQATGTLIFVFLTLTKTEDQDSGSKLVDRGEALLLVVWGR